MVNSKAKGKRWERKVVKLLNKNTNTEWYRVPGSGMYATHTGTDDPRFEGDVYTDNEDMQDHVIECKNTKDKLKLPDFFNKTGKIGQYIEQTENEREKKRGILFIKISRNGTYIAYPQTKQNDIEPGAGLEAYFDLSNKAVLYKGYCIRRIE